MQDQYVILPYMMSRLTSYENQLQKKEKEKYREQYQLDFKTPVAKKLDQIYERQTNKKIKKENYEDQVTDMYLRDREKYNSTVFENYAQCGWSLFRSFILPFEGLIRRTTSIHSTPLGSAFDFFTLCIIDKIYQKNTDDVYFKADKVVFTNMMHGLSHANLLYSERLSFLEIRGNWNRISKQEDYQPVLYCLADHLTDPSKATDLFDILNLKTSREVSSKMQDVVAELVTKKQGAGLSLDQLMKIKRYLLDVLNDNLRELPIALNEIIELFPNPA